MGEALLMRRGGAGSGKKTATPTITFVSKESTKLTFKIKNNENSSVFIYWEINNNQPKANRIELAANTTSSDIIVSGLTKNTQYTVYAWAIAVLEYKALSNVATMVETTVSLPDIAPLSSMSWADIATVAEAGEAANYWAVGDKKAVTGGQAQIIAFGHDNLTGGGKAGITFQLENSLSTTYKMNNSNTNVGGWMNSVMRTSTMVTLFNGLASDLKAVIKPVDKITSKGNNLTTKDTTSDKLFLLSEIEIFGSIEHSVSGEGSQYQFYKSGNSKIKKVGASAGYWWERSPRAVYTTGFCYVGSGGLADYGVASNSRGVAFGFCI